MRKALFVFFAIAASAVAQTSGYGRDFFAYTRINSPTNASNFSAPATVNVIGEAVLPSGPSPYGFLVTNLSLFNNDSLILSQSGPSTTITADVPLLTAGSYTLYSVAKGIRTTYADNSEQGWSAVSASVKVTVGPQGPVPSDGKIILKSLGIPTSQPNPALPGYIPGRDGTGTYNVPIYQDGSGKVGAGLLPGGVTVGLYTAGGTTPLATALLGTLTQTSPYIFTPSSQTVTVTGSAPGSTPTLVIRAWQTSAGSFEGARLHSLEAQLNEWYFTSPPLGGMLPDGSIIPTPTLTGWGPQDGSGVTMDRPPEFPVKAQLNSPIQGSVFASPATVTVVGEALIPKLSYFGLTNLSLFANDVLLGSQSGSATLITARTPPLAAGSYWLTVVADGYLTNGENAGMVLSRTNYFPVNFKVVEPAEISITPPQIASGEFQFNYAANSGLKYVIKTSADLFDWQAIATNTPTANPAVFSQPFSLTPTRYFKVERLPNP